MVLTATLKVRQTINIYALFWKNRTTHFPKIGVYVHFLDCVAGRIRKDCVLVASTVSKYLQTRGCVGGGGGGVEKPPNPYPLALLAETYTRSKES